MEQAAQPWCLACCDAPFIVQIKDETVMRVPYKNTKNKNEKGFVNLSVFAASWFDKPLTIIN